MEKHSDASLGREVVRVVLLGVLGIGSGWLSFMAVAYAPVHEVHEEYLRYSPGTIYGLLWLGLAWWPPNAMAVRDRQRRSLPWSLAFLAGMTFSYAAAYEATQLFLMRVSVHLPGAQGGAQSAHLMLSGMVGAIPGSLGLACVVGFLFRAFDSWTARSIIGVAGVFLGAAIALWSPGNDEGGDPRLMAFFMIWQGGMTVTLGVLDAWWRRSMRTEAAANS